MKTFIARIWTTLALGVVAMMLSGCAHSYVISLYNGRTITTASKPKLKNGFFVWKDVKGQEQSVAQSRVREVAPASMAKEEKERFKP